MRLFAYVSLAAMIAAGCGETAAPSGSRDAGRDASIEPEGGVPDGSVEDGGIDGGLDGGLDGGTPDGGSSWCETSALCPTCPELDSLCDQDTPCPTGEACVSTGCEDFARCFVVGGGGCDSDLDCANPAYYCDSVVGRCLRANPGCDDSNDCVDGFACEGNACVDRRVPCETLLDCPHGYTCFFASPDQRFCRRVTRPCGDDLDCLVLGVLCGDADGDGQNECMPSLMPNEPDALPCDHTQCGEPSAPVCEIAPDGLVSTCGRFGLCGPSVQCAAGFQCRDLWGDGRTECVSGPGSCVDSSQCDPREVCASPRQGGGPSCQRGASR